MLFVVGGIASCFSNKSPQNKSKIKAKSIFEDSNDWLQPSSSQIIGPREDVK